MPPNPPYPFGEALRDLVNGAWKLDFAHYCYTLIRLPPVVRPCRKTEQFLNEAIDNFQHEDSGEEIFDQVLKVLLTISELWENVVPFDDRYDWIDTLQREIFVVMKKIEDAYGLTPTLLEVSFQLEEIQFCSVHTEADYIQVALKAFQLAKKLHQYGANFLTLI